LLLLLLLPAAGRQEHYCICQVNKADKFNQLLLLLLLVLLRLLLLLLLLQTHLFYVEANGWDCRQHLCGKHTQQRHSSTAAMQLSSCPRVPYC
jgi:hypothetical protein